MMFGLFRRYLLPSLAKDTRRWYCVFVSLLPLWDLNMESPNTDVVGCLSFPFVVVLRPCVMVCEAWSGPSLVDV